MDAALKFIADEGVEKKIVLSLRKYFDVTFITEFGRGSTDENILSLAHNQKRILITLDKDFGELVFRMRQLHSGVILCRLEGLTIGEKCKLVEGTILKYHTELVNSFTIIHPKNIRIRKTIS